jgi:hypothetical protein
MAIIRETFQLFRKKDTSIRTNDHPSLSTGLFSKFPRPIQGTIPTLKLQQMVPTLPFRINPKVLYTAAAHRINRNRKGKETNANATNANSHLQRIQQNQTRVCSPSTMARDSPFRNRKLEPRWHAHVRVQLLSS